MKTLNAVFATSTARKSPRRAGLGVVAAAAALTVVLTGCDADQTAAEAEENSGSAEEGVADPQKAGEVVENVEADEEIAAMLPEEYQDTITMGMSFTFPPMRYSEGENRVGAEYDFARAVSKKMGTEMEVSEVSFDGLVPALRADRIDVAVASWADLPDRREEATFIDYYRSATTLLVKKGNPEDIQSLDDMCGKSIAIQHGVESVKRAEKKNEECEADGEELIDINLYESSNDATLAVVNGRADATANDYPAALNEANTIGGGEALELVEKPISSDYYYGFGTRTDEEDLHKALQAAMQALMDSGEYEEIFTSYNVTKGLLEKSGINEGPAKDEL